MQILKAYRDTSLRSVAFRRQHRLEQGCRAAFFLAEVAQPHPDQPVELRNAVGSSSTWDLLSIQSLEKLKKNSFTWPKNAAASAAS